MAPDHAIEDEEPDELTLDEIAVCEQSEAQGVWFSLDEDLKELGL